MAHYIDKDALVAEIKRLKNSFCDRNGYLENCETNGLAYDTLCEFEIFIDTLEVKEIDDMTANGYVKYPRKEFF